MVSKFKESLKAIPSTEKQAKQTPKAQLFKIERMATQTFTHHAPPEKLVSQSSHTNHSQSKKNAVN